MLMYLKEKVNFYKSRQPRERHLYDFGWWTCVILGTLPSDVNDCALDITADPYADFQKGARQWGASFKGVNAKQIQGFDSASQFLAKICMLLK